MYSLPQSYNQTSKCKRCISSNAYCNLILQSRNSLGDYKQYNANYYIVIGVFFVMLNIISPFYFSAFFNSVIFAFTNSIQSGMPEFFLCKKERHLGLSFLCLNLCGNFPKDEAVNFQPIFARDK